MYVYLFFVFLGFGVGVVIGEEARDSGDEGAEDGEEELLEGEGEVVLNVGGEEIARVLIIIKLILNYLKK